jgi:hypothetical protein
MGELRGMMGGQVHDGTKALWEECEGLDGRTGA